MYHVCQTSFVQIIDSGVLEDLSEDEKKLQEVGISYYTVLEIMPSPLRSYF